MAENEIKEPGGSNVRKAAGIFYSAALALSSCVIFYYPDLLFMGCVLYFLYLVLFGLHALWIDSIWRNVIVVCLFWIVPFVIGIIYTYGHVGSWSKTFSGLWDSELAWLLLFPVHILHQMGLWLLFASDRERNGDVHRQGVTTAS